MKRILIAMSLIWSAGAMAEVMVCKQGGYAATAEEFHEIKVEDIAEARFEITPERVMNLNVAIPFEIVDPSTVGFEDLDIKAYMNRTRNEVLYLYKNEEDKFEIGVSTLIDDSDAMYADKTLYTNCSFETLEKDRTAKGGTNRELPFYQRSISHQEGDGRLPIQTFSF